MAKVARWLNGWAFPWVSDWFFTDCQIFSCDFEWLISMRPNLMANMVDLGTVGMWLTLCFFMCDG